MNNEEKEKGLAANFELTDEQKQRLALSIVIDWLDRGVIKTK